MATLKEARIMMWYQMRDYGLQLEQTDINSHAAGLHIDAQVPQPPEVKPPSAAPPAGGKAPAKPPPKQEKGGKAAKPDPKGAAEPAAGEPPKLGIY